MRDEMRDKKTNLKVGDVMFIKSYRGQKLEGVFKTQVVKLYPKYFVLKNTDLKSAKTKYRFYYNGESLKNSFNYYKYHLYKNTVDTQQEYAIFWGKQDLANTEIDLHSWMKFITGGKK